ncbi:MAG TPA: serine/threonine-protein kinase, partial [Thermoanaerobaculia bacterium]
MDHGQGVAPAQRHRASRGAGWSLTETSPDPYWERIRAIFHAASELPEAERAAFVATAADDATVQAEVMSLLSSAREAEEFLEPRPSPVRPFSPGELVASRYAIARLLGSGGMGEVYEAEDRELHETVALKVIRPSIASNPHILARFKREIQLARRVTHPNVCRIYDLAHHLVRAGERDAERKISFVTMELLNGHTLSAHLREHGRLQPADALPLVRQLAAGLDAAHDAGIVHRDFKSANVMLVAAASGSRGTPQTRAVITDFGLAHETDAAEAGVSRLTDSGTFIGTPDYMAPEQLENGP